MSTAPPARLTAELELYETNKSAWLRDHCDEFVVVKGNDPLGFYANFHEAYSAGVAEYGIEADFLVKRVVAQEPVFLVF